MHSVRTGHRTRFNPTTNGDLHLGHVYIALFNEWEAHSNHDKFLVRFENNQPEWLSIYGKAGSQAFADRTIECLEWLGIQVDGYSYQSDMEAQVMDFAEERHIKPPRYIWPHTFPNDPTRIDMSPPLIGGWYGYTASLTFNRVVNDYLQGIDCVIRGDDLRAEFSLYMHYSDELNIPRTMHYYFPRLAHNGKGLSKSIGSKSIYEYKQAGVDPEELLDLLAKSSLKKPEEGWFLCNVKERPLLVEDFQKLT